MSRDVWTEDDLLADVAAAPPGSRVGAFFDFDGTVIDGYSLAAFARHHLRSLHVTPADLGQLLLTGLRGVTTEEDFEHFTEAGMRAWAGRSEDELAELGERLFVQGIAGSLYPEAWRLVTAHLRAGHTVVLASSATRFQVEPAARALGVEHVLVSPVQIIDGICTGRAGGPLLWRAGKASAVRTFAEQHDIDLVQSYAYSNGDEDVPFLRTVGRPRALNPGRGLAEAARHYSWPIARFRPRSRSGPRELARTAGGIGGMLGGFATGLAIGAVSGSRRTAVDLGIALGGDLGTALAGVSLDVEGAEHLDTRPAVFLFNHQSQLDVLVLPKLLRGGFTAVAKKGLENTPGFGLIFRLADVAFVDRGDPAQARRALEPAVQRLRNGLSLVIAPEGTRSATPTLGPFKKGAFHVAMQAGVPIVPIVIRNAGELMWRGATTIQPGTVQVRVLPPIPTTGWTADELDERIAEVRGQYLETLGNWSGREERPVVATEQTGDDGPGMPAAAPLDWGTAAQMNPLETAMWRAEATDPRLRANVTLLELLEPAPDWDRLRAAHEWASRMVPRMRQRVLEPALGIGAPRWVTVQELDLDRHVRRVRLDAPGSMRQLLDVVGEFASAPLERDRPLWQVLLVEGLADGRAGYVVKTHHSTTDGLGAVQLMSRLHSRTAEHDPTRPEPPVPLPDDATPVGVLTDQLAGTVRSAPLAALRRGADAIGLLGSPREAASQAVDLFRSAARTFAPPRAGSSLLATRGGGWHFEVLEVSLSGLKAGARAAGGSLNDGFLAAVLGGFRRYHERLGAPVGTLTLGIPISLRTRDDPQGGNRFTGVRLTASLAEIDPAARVATVREFVLSARESSGSGIVHDLLAPALGWFPAPVLGAVSGWLTSANDVQVSNLPGGADALYIAGSRITRMYPFGPLPGCGAMITLLSHEDQCCIGLNLDSAAVADPAGLVTDLQAGLDEVIALGQ